MHNFKKQYGQNFLRNNDILDKIVNSFSVKYDSLIIEVGPGDGALTKKLITKKTPVISFEIDESLKPFLDNIISDNLSVIYKDFLNIKLKDYIDKNKNLYFVANVPYYITTPIITKFIDENIIPNTMVIMVQKEVAERLSSKPGNREYGAISAILNYYFDIEYLFTVDRNNFYPIPNVDSAVIKLSKKNDLLYLKDFNLYTKLINNAFKHKRKNLRNNLNMYDLNRVKEILNKYELNLKNRAEDLSYEIYVELANNI